MEAYSGVDVLEIMDGAKSYNSYLTNLITSHSSSKRVLDFGAGSGAFAKALRDKGFTVVCVEPDRGLQQSLKKEGFQVYNQLAECHEKFDYIYSINVLEHIENDRGAIEQLHSLLNPQGRLFLYVPAFMAIYTAFDKKIGHFRRYTKSQLLPLMNRYHVEDCYYVDSLGFFAALAYKWIGPKDGSVSVKSVKIFDRLLFPISRCLDVILKSFIGKNLLLVAQKR